MNFQAYLTNSLEGVLTNQFLMAIYLSAIVFTLRSYWEKYFHNERNENAKRIILEILFFIFIIPASLLVLFFLIFVFWTISFIQ